MIKAGAINEISIYALPSLSSLLLLSTLHPTISMPPQARPGQARDRRHHTSSTRADLRPLFPVRRLHRFADYGRLQALCNSDKTSPLLQIGLNINNELKDSPQGEILMTFSLWSGINSREG